MPLAVIVGLTVAVVIVLMGAAGYLIERSASAQETPEAERRPPRI